jgi:hypothetical protein
MPDQAVKGGGWRHPGWSWTVRRGRLITLGAGLGTWLFGVGISVGLVLIQGGLAADSRLRLQWTAFAALGLAIVVWACTWIARAGRARMLTRNGVAYLVRERARDWAQDSPDDFYAEVRERFAEVVTVPRSEEVGQTWDWPLDNSGARLWDAKVTDLVSTFRVLLSAVHARHAEEGTSGVPDAIFVTAWWAVALAFGRRLRLGIRNWELNVWQRPSDARAGKIDPVLWRRRPHQFAGQAVTAPPGLTPREFAWDVDLTVSRPDGTAGEVPSGPPVSVLLLRFGRGRWGSLRLEDPVRPVPLTLIDAAGVIGVKEAARVLVHELRCVPRDEAPAFDWEDFPFLAAIAVDWIQRKAGELEGRTLLLGATVPNEVALGIGIAAGRPACDGWPSSMWPVIYRQPTDTLVVPRLDLGATQSAE